MRRWRSRVGWEWAGDHDVTEEIRFMRVFYQGVQLGGCVLCIEKHCKALGEGWTSRQLVLISFGIRCTS